MIQASKAAQVNAIGAYAGLLAATEIGLGGILHASHIPLRGQFLSLNQIFILMRASIEAGKQSSRLLPIHISSIAAILKSLSPIGNKLTPMLAISIQGWLFTVGILLFGHSTLGRILGGLLSSLWAFIQPILLYGVIFGSTGKRTLLFGIQELSRWTAITEEMVLYCLAGIVITKMLLVVAIGCITPKLSKSWLTTYAVKISSFMPSPSMDPPKQTGIRRAMQGAIKQLCGLPFLLSITLTATFLFSVESDSVVLIRHVLRSIGFGLILFFAMRLLPLEKIALWLQKNNSSTLGQALSVALQKVRGY